MTNKTIQKSQNTNDKLRMYFSKDICEKFAELEQNEKNFKVAEIVDIILMQESSKMKAPIRVAELGGGAHPDRYHAFFKKLLKEPKGKIDWVDISSYMLELADKYISTDKYKARKKVIRFIESDICDYLRSLDDRTLDIVIMKYTIDYISNLEELFKLLAKKLKNRGKLIATIGSLNPELRSCSTNARFLYNGKEFSDNETRTLTDGDNFTVKFFKVSGDPTKGYLDGAETIKHYHSEEKIRKLAKSNGFEIFLGDWKGIVSKEKQENIEIEQITLVIRN